MYEILKEQFKSGKALSQSKYHGSVKKELWPKINGDLHPLVQEYYHELNPYFLFNVYRTDFYKFAKVMTVRDGYVTFANFIINNFSNFSRLEAGLLLIHPDLAPIVPPNLSSSFATWKIVQKKQVELLQAKKVIIFGFISDQYLGNMDDLADRLQVLKKVSPDVEIDLYLPIRRNVFEATNKESVAIHTLMSHIKDILPGRKFRILTSDHFFDITNFNNTYVFDLAPDKFIVSDNYIHYYVQSRGATVNNNSLTKAPEDSVFSFELSLNHELHVCPLPKGKNIFTELLFYRKENPQIKDLTLDPLFQSMLREGLKK